jgi:hypothetical protein
MPTPYLGKLVTVRIPKLGYPLQGWVVSPRVIETYDGAHYRFSGKPVEVIREARQEHVFIKTGSGPIRMYRVADYVMFDCWKEFLEKPTPNGNDLEYHLEQLRVLGFYVKLSVCGRHWIAGLGLIHNNLHCQIEERDTTAPGATLQLLLRLWKTSHIRN